MVRGDIRRKTEVVLGRGLPGVEITDNRTIGAKLAINHGLALGIVRATKVKLPILRSTTTVGQLIAALEEEFDRLPQWKRDRLTANA